MAITPKQLSLEDIDALEPDYIGPTWKRHPVTGKWHLPKRTIGWQVAEWAADYLNAEDGGPWKFTLEQLRFVLWWYAVDESGRFVYRKGVLQRMKGWGKDPLLAVLCLVELCGPCRFGGFDQDGTPIGVPHPQAWVQVTAVNQSQTRNTMSLIPSLMSDKFKDTYNIKDGAEVIRANGGKQRLEAVTSSFRAIEGGRTTFTLLNETHHWVEGNKGHDMYATIDGNATKKDSRYLAITNAFLPGEDSVAERMRYAWQAIQDGKAPQIGFLYDSVEAHPETPLTPDALRIVLPKIRGDAHWLNIETIIQSVLDATLAPSRSRRMWLNQVIADEDALYGAEHWIPLEDDSLLLSPGDAITMGFDGGKSDDATVLVALRISDMAAFVLALEEQPDGPAGDGWEVNREKIDGAVRHAFRTYDVKGFYADVALWESYIDEWAKDWDQTVETKASNNHAFAWDMRSSTQAVTRAHERLMTTIFDRKIKHDGDPDLRRHVLNTRRAENNYGVSFRKESRESKRKVDLYAGLMLAHEAVHDLRTRVTKKKKRTGNVMFF